MNPVNPNAAQAALPQFIMPSMAQVDRIKEIVLRNRHFGVVDRDNIILELEELFQQMPPAQPVAPVQPEPVTEEPSSND